MIRCRMLTGSSWRLAFGLALLAVTAGIVGALAASPASGLPKTVGPAAGERTPTAATVATPLSQRVGPQPFLAVRALGIIHERIIQGDRDAFDRQAELIGEIARELGTFPDVVWADARNRHAAIRFVLGGGDPSVVRRLLDRTLVPAPELALAHGALAFATGDPIVAAKQLADVDLRTLGPSLAGLVTLIRCTLAAESDVAAAMRLCDEARLLSPGTIVEESALRVSIELAIGDRARSARLISLYLRRFARSLYLPVVRPHIARHLAVHDALADPAAARWLAASMRQLTPDVRGLLLRDAAEEALRRGKPATAAAAARRLFDHLPGTAPERSRALVYEGAARMLLPESGGALALLDEAERYSLDADVRELAAAARALAVAITGPPKAAASDRKAVPRSEPPGLPTSGTPLRSRAAIAAADRLLAETAP